MVFWKREWGKTSGHGVCVVPSSTSLCLHGAAWPQLTHSHCSPAIYLYPGLALITPEGRCSLSFWCVCRLCLVG